jgi:hypothetical protein
MSIPECAFQGQCVWRPSSCLSFSRASADQAREGRSIQRQDQGWTNPERSVTERQTKSVSPARLVDLRPRGGGKSEGESIERVVFLEEGGVGGTGRADEVEIEIELGGTSSSSRL